MYASNACLQTVQERLNASDTAHDEHASRFDGIRREGEALGPAAPPGQVRQLWQRGVYVDVSKLNVIKHLNSKKSQPGGLELLKHCAVF